MRVDNANHFPQIFRRSVIRGIEPKLFVRLRGDVPAWEVLLRAPYDQQQPAALAGILRCRVRLDRDDDVFSHDQLLETKLTAGNPPKLSSLLSPKRNLHDDRQPLH